MLRVLKYEIEAKERFGSAGVPSFERQMKKIISLVLKIFLYKAATKIRFVYYVIQNGALHGDFFLLLLFHIKWKEEFSKQYLQKQTIYNLIDSRTWTKNQSQGTLTLLPENTREHLSFLMFSGGKKWVHWEQNGLNLTIVKHVFILCFCFRNSQSKTHKKYSQQ